MNKIDLYLGSDLGLWALDQIPVDNIQQVFTFEDEIAAKSREAGIRVWLGNANSFDFEAAPIGLSVHYPKILNPHILSKYEGLYNLHPGYLPWGRGFYPIFWALWEQTPAGATLHKISPGVDEGPIVAQLQVEYYAHDTGESLFQRVREAEKTLFLDYWPQIISSQPPSSFLQEVGVGSYHSRKDFFEIKERADIESMSACDLLRLARCLTFSTYSGLIVTLGQQTFELRLSPLKI